MSNIPNSRFIGRFELVSISKSSDDNDNNNYEDNYNKSCSNELLKENIIINNNISNENIPPNINVPINNGSQTHYGPTVPSSYLTSPPSVCFPPNFQQNKKILSSSASNKSISTELNTPKEILPPLPEYLQQTNLSFNRPNRFEDSLEELENRLMEALRLQREEEVAVLQFNRWQANVFKTQHTNNLFSGSDSKSCSAGVNPFLNSSHDTVLHQSLEMVDKFDEIEDGFITNTLMGNDANSGKHIPHTKSGKSSTQSKLKALPPALLPWTHDRDHEDATLLSYEDLKFCEKIGEGAFGCVFRSLLWGQEVAVKKLLPENPNKNKDNFDAEGREMFNYTKLVAKYMCERNLRHPNILNFMGISFRPPNELCIVTEYLSCGSLAKILENRLDEGKGSLPTMKIIRYAKDVARALNYLHHKGVIHRDLKPSNLLLDKSDSVKISDFGLSHFKKFTPESDVVGKHGVCGTPIYMAPEVFQSLPYGTKADVFSFGIVFAELLIGDYPYRHLEPFVSSKTFEAAVKSGVRPLLPSTTPEPLRRLIEACWKIDPDNRPDCTTLLAWLSNIEESLQYLNPSTLLVRSTTELESSLLIKKKPSHVVEFFKERSNSICLAMIPQMHTSTKCSADVLLLHDKFDLHTDDFIRLINDDKARILALSKSLDTTKSQYEREQKEVESLNKQAVDMQIETARLEDELKNMSAILELKDAKIEEQSKEIEKLLAKIKRMETNNNLMSSPLPASTPKYVPRDFKGRSKRLFLANSNRQTPKAAPRRHFHFDYPGIMLPSLYLTNENALTKFENDFMTPNPAVARRLSNFSLGPSANDELAVFSRRNSSIPDETASLSDLSTLNSPDMSNNNPANIYASPSVFPTLSPLDSSILPFPIPFFRSIVSSDTSSIIGSISNNDIKEKIVMVQAVEASTTALVANFTFASAIAPPVSRSLHKNNAPSSNQSIRNTFKPHVNAPISEPHDNFHHINSNPNHSPVFSSINGIPPKSAMRNAQHVIHHHYHHVNYDITSTPDYTIKPPLPALGYNELGN